MFIILSLHFIGLFNVLNVVKSIKIKFDFNSIAPLVFAIRISIFIVPFATPYSYSFLHVTAPSFLVDSLAGCPFSFDFNPFSC